MKTANVGLRFLLEILTLVSLGYWGLTTGSSLPVSLALGIGAPLAAAVLWGAFVAPKAAVRASLPVRLSVEALVFGSAALALVAAGRPGLGIAFAVAALLSGIIHHGWGGPGPGGRGAWT